MKKILVFILFVGILATIDHVQIFEWLNDTDQEIVAYVNGDVIRFEDIEAMYDTKYAHKTIQAPRVAELHREYASLLYTRIEQLLVAQELAKRGLEIMPERVQAFELLISQNHFDEKTDEQKTFQELVEESGIEYSFWKEQLRTRLQIETLQQDITKNIVLQADEVLQYVKDHPELALIIDNYEIILLRSSKKEPLEALKKEGFYNENFIAENGIKVRTGFFSAQNVPEEYKEILAALPDKHEARGIQEDINILDKTDSTQHVEATQSNIAENINAIEPAKQGNVFTSILKVDDDFEMLYLVEHRKTIPPNALTLYSLAEEALLAEKAPEVYDAWLLQAIENSNIKIESEFLPTNLPHVPNHFESQRLEEMVEYKHSETILLKEDS